MCKWLKILLCALPLLAFSSCDFSGNRSEPLAKVGNRTLYLSDVSGIFPQIISVEDSITMLRSYVEMWVKKELLLKLAEENLSSKQKDVADMLDEYRTSLLVYRYEQEYIKQRIDTTVSNAEIEQFYTTNRQFFTLIKPLVRAIFIKMKKNSPYLDRVRSLYRSSSPDDLSTLENLCFQAALKFDYFGDRWLELDELTRELPPRKSYEEQALQNRYIEVSDDMYVYLVAIRDARARESVAPLEYERNNIKAMILSRRKQQMMEELEKQVLREAKYNKTIKIFLDE